MATVARARIHGLLSEDELFHEWSKEEIESFMRTGDVAPGMSSTWLGDAISKKAFEKPHPKGKKPAKGMTRPQMGTDVTILSPKMSPRLQV